MEYKKINVLIVTYKQADVIGRNIDSILQQKDYGLNEIVICDDCSPDNNWEIIQTYVQKYPDLIRAYRNDANLGIYGNSDKCASLHGDADLYCWLEGDDALEPGVFKKLQECIISNSIDMNEAVGIFCDYCSITPDGVKTRHLNNRILSRNAPLSLFIRGLVSWRASFFTEKVINKFVPTVLDKGLALSEILFDSQWFRFVEKTYYCPILGSAYYTEIGVSTQLGYQSTFKKEQALVKWTYLLDNGYAFDRRDKNWLKFKIYQAQCLLNPQISVLFKCIYYYFAGRYSGVRFRRNFSPIFKSIINER